MPRPHILLATWFGCGYSPSAPGTVGSAAGILIAWLLISEAGLSAIWLIPLTLVLTPAGIWAADATARDLGREDPGLVVVDEVLGQWLTASVIIHPTWQSYALAFALFRIFDITKPWPIRRLEGLHGGLGIVADDLLAGVYGALILFAAGHYKLV
ncbi:MAG TPA: phosphatidylglycerophosphatase A [Bryobacteraceae bacterium]|jgi:phosphatidylglycerophosphatase A